MVTIRTNSEMWSVSLFCSFFIARQREICPSSIHATLELHFENAFFITLPQYAFSWDELSEIMLQSFL